MTGKSTLIFCVCVLFLAAGCKSTRYITERYIKTEIEKHEPQQFSTIRTVPIYAAMLNSGTTRVELTGYKYEGKKGLVIGADRYYTIRYKYTGNVTRILEGIDYVKVDETQANGILEKISELESKIKTEKPVMNETVYWDYTVNDDLVLSFAKGFNNSVSVTHIWIKDEKYSVPRNTLVGKLKTFLSY